MFNLSPKEEKFFTYFNEFSKIISDATHMLVNFTENLQNAEIKFREIEEIEHRGDKQLHDIMQALNKTYLTPFDREDIYAIAKALDDIVDCVEATASKFLLFNVTEATDYAKTISKKIAEAGEEVTIMMKELKTIKGNKNLSNSIIKINRLEDEGDTDFREAVKSLFITEVPPIEVLKWREIYENLEETLDSCEDLADIIEGVVMKHA